MNFIRRMKADEDFRRKVIGMILILFMFLIIGYVVKTFVFGVIDDKNENAGSSSDYTVTEEESTVSGRPENQEEEYAGVNGSEEQKDIDINEYASTVHFNIPEEIQRYIPLEKLAKEFEAFMVEADLLTENTRADSDGCITLDFENDLRTFNLTLNDYSSTVVNVTIDKDDEISFLYR